MPQEYMSSIAKEVQPAVETEQQTIANTEKRVATYEVAIKNAKNPEEVIKFADKLQEELDVLYA
jgi:NCAIR mutase (PurE)-related protein